MKIKKTNKIETKLGIILAVLIVFTPNALAAHYITGIVNDAYDGEAANDKTIVLWNPSNGINDNLTDVIGPNGNSNTDNVYMIDCQSLNTKCRRGDEMRVKVMNTGDNYITSYVSTIITGGGYTEEPNLTLNSIPVITSIEVDDSLTTPENQIDLNPGTTKKVICEAYAYDNDSVTNIENVSAEFFSSDSFYGDANDNNTHYSNSSCFVNKSYGDNNEVKISCDFNVQYYANSDYWNCTIELKDNLSISYTNTDETFIRKLLSINLENTIDFGELSVEQVSGEKVLNVTNYGNVPLNLTLSGYGYEEGDNLAMNCTQGDFKNISVYYKKFNLTESNSGSLDLSNFENLYENLSSNPEVYEFNLDYKKDETPNQAYNETYWRIYVPAGVSGSCQGNIVFGATQAGEQ